MTVLPDTHRNTPIQRQKSYNLTTSPGSRAITMNLRCAQCGEMTKVNWSHGHFDTRIVRFWTNKGWNFDLHKKKACICPKCKQGDPIPMQTNRSKPGPITVVDLPVKALATEAPTPPLLPKPLTREQRAQVRDLIEDNFDDRTGRYKPGWTDKRIGEIVGVAFAAVTNLREAAFGPLDETDPELVNLRNEFDTLKSMLFDCERRLVALERKPK